MEIESHHSSQPAILFEEVRELIERRPVKKIFTTSECAVACLQEDGNVVTFGLKRSGGDYRAVEGLGNVVQIVSTDAAFAALTRYGIVYTWGRVV